MQNGYFEGLIHKILGNTKEFHYKNKNNRLFTLWISDDNKLPELQQLSLKSMVLTGHQVILYTYDDLEQVPEGINLADANKIIDESNIFVYKEGFNKGSYSGFANWFRAKCLYENGLSWFDCDILAIKNINELNKKGPIISSQKNLDGTISPNNAFLRLEKRDKLLKELLIHMEKVRDNIKHAQTGPNLLKSCMDNGLNDYYNYLSSPNFIASINYFEYKDILKPYQEIVPFLKLDEIWGFHIWNAMFRHYGNVHEKTNDGFYHELKDAILTSFSKEDYREKIINIFL
jgi:hypothetical protein